MATVEWWRLIESSGYHFCKARGGFALFDEDDRKEVQGTWAPTTGESVWLAVKALDLKEN